MMNIAAVLFSPFISIAARQIVAGFAANPSPTPVTVLLSSSPDYWIDGFTAVSVLVSSIVLLAAFRAIRVNKEQAQASIEASQKQSEASLQVSQASVNVAMATVEEMRTAREEESAPYVIAYFDLDVEYIYVVVKNVGKSVARDLTLSIDPPFVITHPSRDLNKASLFQNGATMLAPESELRLFYTTTMTYFGIPNAPRQHKMMITYAGGSAYTKYEHEMVLDLSVYDGMGHFNESDFSDLVKEIKDIKEAFQSLNETHQKVLTELRGGIWIKNTELFTTDLNEGAASQAFIDAKLQEFSTKWQHTIYKTTSDTNAQGNEIQFIDSDEHDTRHDCSIFGQEILFALSKCQPLLSGELYEKIVDVATTLFRMSKMTDKYSIQDFSAEFNEAGEHVLQTAKEITALQKKTLPSTTGANASI